MSRENVAVSEDDDRYLQDPLGLGCALDAFAEHADVEEWIEGLPDAAREDYAMEKHRQRFTTVMDRYVI